MDFFWCGAKTLTSSPLRVIKRSVSLDLSFWPILLRCINLREFSGHGFLMSKKGRKSEIPYEI